MTRLQRIFKQLKTLKNTFFMFFFRSHVEIIIWFYLEAATQRRFLKKAVLHMCSKFRGEHPCRSTILIKLLCNFIEIALRHECSPINLLHIIRTPFLKKTSEWLLLKIVHQILANLQTDNLIANNLQRKCCTRQALFHLQQLVIFYQHL